MAGETDQASAGDTLVSKPSQLMKNCWGCRVLSGGGLILAALYVYNGAKHVIRKGGPVSFGSVAQITFAAALAAWGFVVITDPEVKPRRKE